MAQRSADRARAPRPIPISRDRGRSHDHHATDRARWDLQRLQCRDDAARALRAVFSSHDNWSNLSEAEREEWRGYFDGMLERLHRLGYTPERNPWSVLLEDLRSAANRADERTRLAREPSSVSSNGALRPSSAITCPALSGARRCLPPIGVSTPAVARPAGRSSCDRGKGRRRDGRGSTGFGFVRRSGCRGLVQRAAGPGSVGQDVLGSTLR